MEGRALGFKMLSLVGLFLSLFFFFPLRGYGFLVEGSTLLVFLDHGGPSSILVALEASLQRIRGYGY